MHPRSVQGYGQPEAGRWFYPGSGATGDTRPPPPSQVILYIQLKGYLMTKGYLKVPVVMKVSEPSTLQSIKEKLEKLCVFTQPAPSSAPGSQAADGGGSSSGAEDIEEDPDGEFTASSQAASGPLRIINVGISGPGSPSSLRSHAKSGAGMCLPAFEHVDCVQRMHTAILATLRMHTNTGGTYQTRLHNNGVVDRGLHRSHALIGMQVSEQCCILDQAWVSITVFMCPCHTEKVI